MKRLGSLVRHQRSLQVTGVCNGSYLIMLMISWFTAAHILIFVVLDQLFSYVYIRRCNSVRSS